MVRIKEIVIFITEHSMNGFAGIYVLNGIPGCKKAASSGRERGRSCFL
jgi:hypothetical protein